MNSTFLEPLEEYKLPALLEHLPQEDILEILRVSEVFKGHFRKSTPLKLLDWTQS